MSEDKAEQILWVWFPRIWGPLLFVGLSLYLLYRLQVITDGGSLPIDTAASVLWCALAIAPLFSEMKLYGLHLKREISRKTEELRSEIQVVRNQLTSISTSNNSLAQSINVYPSTPTDPQVRSREAELMPVLTTAHGNGGAAPSTIAVPDQALQLFQTRYRFESLIRGSAEEWGIATRRRPAVAVLNELALRASVPDALAAGVTDLLSICSRAIHGEEVSPAQYSFVERFGPEMMLTLESHLASQASNRPQMVPADDSRN